MVRTLLGGVEWPHCSGSARRPIAAWRTRMTLQENTKRQTRSRTRVLMTATVISSVGSHKVLVRDISRTGAQIYADNRVPKGHDVCFGRGKMFVAAHIAWSRQGVAGLQFYRELTKAEREAAFPSVVPIEGDER